MNYGFILVAAATLLASAPLQAQTASGVYVVTYVDVQPAATATGAAMLARYVRATRADAGNLGVHTYEEIGRPNQFVVAERWKDEASFDAHEKAAHTLQSRAQLQTLRRSPDDQRVNLGFAIDPTPAAAGTQAVYVVTHVDVPPEGQREAESLLRQLAESSRDEPGHVRYDVYQQPASHGNHFTIFAVWSNRRAFDAAGHTAGWAQFRQALQPLLGAPYDERLYRAVGP